MEITGNYFIIVLININMKFLLVQHFSYTMSNTDQYKCMLFKAVKQLNMIVAMKTFKKPNCNSYMEER